MGADTPGTVVGNDEEIPLEYVSNEWFEFVTQSNVRRCIPVGLTENLTTDLRMRPDLPGADKGLDVAVLNFAGQQRNLGPQTISSNKVVAGYLPVTEMVVKRLTEMRPGLRVGGVVPQFVSQYDEGIVNPSLATAPNCNVAFWDPDGAPQGRNCLRRNRQNEWTEDLTADGISSYEVIREIALALKAANPNLQRIIVMGHSAGAIMASHLAVTFILDDVGVEVVYMPANASNVPNLNEINVEGKTPEEFGRPHTVEELRELLVRNRNELADPSKPGYLTDERIAELTSIEKLAHADDWPCGVGGYLPAVLANMSRPQFRNAAASHTIVGIAGAEDTTWSVGLGVDLSRLLLGLHRNERMQEWVHHLMGINQELKRAGNLGAPGRKELILVSGAEHQAPDVFGDPSVLSRMTQGLDRGPVLETLGY